MTAAHTMSRSQAAVQHLPRRIPVRASEPPYDDEPGVAGPAQPMTDGALALDLSSDVTLPTALRRTGGTDPGRRLRVVDDERPAREDTYFAPQPTPSESLPDPRAWAGRFVQAMVEVLAGARPASQLLRWTDENVYADVLRRVRARATGTPTPARGGRGRTLIRSVHVSSPRDGVVEAAIHLCHGGRSRAVAMRLEGLDGRWRCTALCLG